MKALGYRLIIVMASSILTLFVLEVCLAIFFPQQLIVIRDDIWRPDATFGYRHRENVNTVVNTGERTVRFLTDSFGYRVTGKRPDQSPGDRAVLMIGDSFVAGMQTENEETICGHLESGLSRAGKSVRVDNSGVSGWTPNHYLLEARRALTVRDYDLGIVCLYVGNDVVDRQVRSHHPRKKAERNSFELPPSLEWIEIVHAVLLPMNDILESKSHLYTLLKTRLRPHLLPLVQGREYHPPVFDVRETESPRWEMTATICQNISDVFVGRSVPVVFVLIPTIYQVRQELWPAHLALCGINPASVDLTLPTRTLGKAFERRDLVLMDPSDVLRKASEAGKQLHGIVDPHLNSSGNQFIADFLLPSVEGILYPSEFEQTD